MLNLSYTIRLVSDAETSSGLGSDLIDGLVARNVDGNPVIPASHIKGLMRQVVKDLPGFVSDDKKKKFLDAFGVPGALRENGALFSVTDACVDGEAATRLISRTAIDENGVAKDSSLRTNEAISAGSKFSGHVHLNVDSKFVDLLVRYSLLSVFEVGGSRNRGAGACVVSIADEKRTPGMVLRELLALNDFAVQESSSSECCTVGNDETVFVKLSFVADSSICVPELPIVGNNTIVSGFAIPASAVQGCILTKINSLNPAVATAAFESENFRTWPMLPIPNVPGFDGCYSVWASASHKISKLANANDTYNFCDEMIEPFQWEKCPKNAPIKSADGVLIACGTDKVSLWRSGDMARHLSAHGVVNGGASDDERAFYTIESLAEKRFVGFAAMPEKAFRLLENVLGNEKNPGTDPVVSIGKARTVRGTGKLFVEKVDSLPVELPRTSKDNKIVPAFIVQSPILVDSDITAESADEILKTMVERAGWGEVEKASASIRILFGWNRHKNGLQKAERVIAPGSVFSLRQIPDNLCEKFLKGIGGGKERGFGAVLPHPSIAKSRYIPNPEKKTVASANDAAKEGWLLWKTSQRSGNPLSASQISQLICRIAADKTADKVEVKAYFDKQLHRPDNIWDRWKFVMEDIETLLEKDSAYVKAALNVWHDLRVAEE
ncbi:RAMP superfamily CRISPR-associated protein [uncultured Fibrobacter sp.]|uniref:RAMP superfamily CRISPR-associated protein n=1 Tax=uncultured Fibrobacter sp. TaxID=261512 RepID=UPI00259A1637|nr:RAMP superfamily CRISPR-associated protein [uncultured Fibrobacter sp.]